MTKARTPVGQLRLMTTSDVEAAFRLQGRWCLDPHEDLSPGQSEEIDRVCWAYPYLQDNEFVQEHLDEWLS